jgi:hypothetical protein
MPSIFNWKPKKLAAHIRVKSPTFKKLTGGQQRSDADDIKGLQSYLKFKGKN